MAQLKDTTVTGDLTVTGNINNDTISNIVEQLGNLCAKGDDGNGNKYYKFSDGTLICTKAVGVTNYACTSAWGGLYDGASINFGNWLHAFISTPATTVTFKATNNYAMIEGMGNSLSTTSAGETYLCRGTQATVSGVIHIIGIGRWK